MRPGPSQGPVPLRKHQPPPAAPNARPQTPTLPRLHHRHRATSPQMPRQGQPWRHPERSGPAGSPDPQPRPTLRRRRYWRVGEGEGQAGVIGITGLDATERQQPHKPGPHISRQPRPPRIEAPDTGRLDRVLCHRALRKVLGRAVLKKTEFVKRFLPRAPTPKEVELWW